MHGVFLKITRDTFISRVWPFERKERKILAAGEEQNMAFQMNPEGKGQLGQSFTPVTHLVPTWHKLHRTCAPLESSEE